MAPIYPTQAELVSYNSFPLYYRVSNPAKVMRYHLTSSVPVLKIDLFIQFPSISVGNGGYDVLQASSHGGWWESFKSRSELRSLWIGTAASLVAVDARRGGWQAD